MINRKGLLTVDTYGLTKEKSVKVAKLTEIRWHARGGQGAKTAATFLAEAAIGEGKFSQGFPDYGPERMGAPMRGFTRISDHPIRLHSAIEEPDTVVVLDDTLLDTVNVCEGLSEDGTLIINTTKEPEVIRRKLSWKGKRLFLIDATHIALDELGRPIPNTPMLGALVKVSNTITLDVLLEDIQKKFAKKFKAQIVEGNLRAIKRAYEEVKSV
jgi:pyruvate ferredoxin oxidoreductase gamma subunit